MDSLAKLDAMRWDLNGDGLVDDTTDATAVTGYAAAFPNRLAGMGCAHDDDNDPNTPTVLAPCLGYELTAALDFDTGAAGDRTDDDYHDGGKGWKPIGDTSTPYTGEFDGRGHTIANLFINRDNANDVGLFGALQSSTVGNLRLTGVNVTGVMGVGALAGRNLGDDSISGIAVSGSVSGASEVGGLAGKNDKGTSPPATPAVAVSATGGDAGGLVGESEDGDIRASYATGAVSGSGSGQGGLVGRLAGGSIRASFSTGAVSGSGANIGGLVGLASDSPTIANSYWETEASGRAIGVGSDDADGSGAVDGTETETAGVTGQTTAALRGPSRPPGTPAHANWNVSIDGDTTNDDPWDFAWPTLPGAEGGLQQRRHGHLAGVRSAAGTWAGAEHGRDAQRRRRHRDYLDRAGRFRQRPGCPSYLRVPRQPTAARPGRLDCHGQRHSHQSHH